MDLHDKEMNLPTIHLWVKLGLIKEMYLVNEKNAQVFAVDLQDEDEERLVEIPDDCLKKIKIFDSDIYEIIVEMKNKDGTWPRAKQNFDRDQLQTGDIIDFCDHWSNWYEGLIRCVFRESSDKYGKCAIHVIGTNAGYYVFSEEEIDINDIDRIAKRHTYSRGPYRSWLG